MQKYKKIQAWCKSDNISRKSLVSNTENFTVESSPTIT